MQIQLNPPSVSRPWQQQMHRTSGRPITVSVNNSKQPNTEIRSVTIDLTTQSNVNPAKQHVRGWTALTVNITRYGHYVRQLHHLTLVNKTPNNKPQLQLVTADRARPCRDYLQHLLTNHQRDLHMASTSDPLKVNSLPTALAECPWHVTKVRKN